MLVLFLSTPPILDHHIFSLHSICTHTSLTSLCCSSPRYSLYLALFLTHTICSFTCVFIVELHHHCSSESKLHRGWCSSLEVVEVLLLSCRKQEATGIKLLADVVDKSGLFRILTPCTVVLSRQYLLLTHSINTTFPPCPLLHLSHRPLSPLSKHSSSQINSSLSVRHYNKEEF